MRSIFTRIWAAALISLLWAIASGSAFAFTQPNFVNTRLEGCKQPPGADVFVCADSEYTTGNLQKLWNELDLVPHRLTTDSGTQANATTTYNIYIAADYKYKGSLGYDVITVPVVNGSKSHASCQVSPVGGQQVGPGITGGADQSIYRELLISQDKGTTCVFDWVQRLAVGAAQYSGSSLQSYEFEQAGLSGGKKTVPLPVGAIKPQELSKTMSASQNAERAWNLIKSATPTSVDFGNVCKAPSLEKAVEVKVTWTKLATSPSGDVTVLTNISVKNPAARKITVNVTDKVYTGQDTSGTLLDTQSVSKVVTAYYNGHFHTFTYVIPAAKAGNIGDWLNDKAEATYTDDYTGVPVDLKTTATAKAQIQLGTTVNETANIADLEEISGTGLKFKVAAPSAGAFNGYIAGNLATSVNWGVMGLTDSGSVTFYKTVVLDAKRITSGELVDSAALVSTDTSYTVRASLAPVTITSSALVELTIVKKLPIALKEGEKVVTKFTVTPAGGSPSDVYVTHTGPTAFGASAQTTLKDLEPTSYTVAEVESIYYASESASGTKMPWTPDFKQQTKDLSPKAGGVMDDSNCAGTLTFVNSYSGDPVQAQVKKVTLPALPSGDPDYTWKFTLYGPPGVIEEKSVNADGVFVKFDFVITEEGTYWIEETLKPKWDLYGIVQPDGSSSANSKCTFIVDFPAAYEQAPFSCTFTNRKRGDVKVIKTLQGQPTTAQFTFQLRKDASLSAEGTALETLTTNKDGSGSTLNFTTPLIPGDTYQMCEATQAGWMTSFNDPTRPMYVPGAFMPPVGTIPNEGVDNSWLCVDFKVDPGQTKVFNIDNSPPPGGRALTIGFWKNHASCVGPLNKNNATALDETLYGMLPSGILRSSTIDSKVSDQTGLFGQYDKATADCNYAVTLLDKRDFSDKKKASDPLFNMVAQLVATELNLASGAYTCGAVTTAVARAEELLWTYKFDGFGYKNMQGKQQLSKDDATLANSLATKLDDYNNNRPGVCP